MVQTAQVRVFVLQRPQQFNTAWCWPVLWEPQVNRRTKMEVPADRAPRLRRPFLVSGWQPGAQRGCQLCDAGESI